MREIKFRAWMDGELKHWDIHEDAPHWNIETPITQYTGLKDAHANDIYEGDIVLYKKLISVVEWMWYMWIFKHKDMCDMAQDHVVASSHSSVTIIGNIYENPELL